MSTNTFLAVVGTVIVVLTGILTLQKLEECRQKGGVACCFGRLCPAQKAYFQKVSAGSLKRTLILWRVEAKLDLLLKQANLSFDPYQSLPPGVVEALQRGEKIRAIKFYREATGVGLKEAKDFVEEVQRRGPTLES
jgi:hypothetical protein